MVIFDLWNEAFIFFAIYSVVIIVPCVFVAIIGHRMVTQLGLYPSQTPVIQMSIIYKLVTIEVITFYLLISVYTFFSN